MMRVIMKERHTVWVEPKVDKKAKAKGAMMALFDKSKCMDIYKYVTVDEMNLYERRSDRVMFKYKYDSRIIHTQLNKCQLMKALGGVHDVLYIKTTLK